MSEQLPEGWKTLTFGDVLAHRKEGDVSNGFLLSVTADRGVILQSESGRRDISSGDKSSYNRVCPGDIVYNTMRMWQGVSGVSDYSGIVSPAYTVCAPTGEVDAKFLSYLLKHPEYVNRFRRMSQGLVSDTWNLKFREFAKMPVVLPSAFEQRRIVEVLGAMDNSVQAYEGLVGKSEVLRHGLVRGLLRENLPNTESGGFGYMPKEWKVSTIGSCFEVSSGITLSSERVPLSGSSPYLRVANVKRGFVDLSDVTRLQANSSERVFYSLRPGDLLVVEGHASPNEIGRCALVRQIDPGTLYQNHLFRLRGKRVDSRFSEIWMNSDIAIRYWRVNCSTSSGLNTINMSQLKRLPMAIPPMEDQQRIVSIVEAHDTRIAAERARLEKLRKLKAGLMDDLLTGRVRVNQLQDLPV